MTLDEVQSAVQQSVKQYAALAEHAIMNRLECDWIDVEKFCESEIEKRLALAVIARSAARHDFQQDTRRRCRTLYFGPDGGRALDIEHVDELLGGFQDALVMISQVPVGDFRADFVIRRFSQSWTDGRWLASTKLVVECDGHEFHERTKQQASRDRRRDRLMLSGGLPVMRFTGWEIWHNAAYCADEIDEYLHGQLQRQQEEQADERFGKKT